MVNESNNSKANPSEPFPDIPTAQEGFVVLPVKRDQFTDFLKGLLGRPQTISKNIRGSFEISRNDLQNIHHLLIQRITQQNQGTLLQMTSRIVYNDNSSVLLGSPEEFGTYNEVRPVYPIAVHLEWTFIVKFNDKGIPERQTIRISFYSSDRVIPDIDENNSIGRIFLISSSSGTINFRIEHTARTWGADIEALLSNHLETLMFPRQPIRDFIREHNGLVGLIAGILFLVTSGICLIHYNKVYNCNILSKAKSITMLANNDNTLAIKAKIDSLVMFIASDPIEILNLKISIFVIVLIVISIGFGIFVSEFADNKQPSFILLTNTADKHKKTRLKKAEKKWIAFTFTLLLGLIIDILSHYIFNFWVIPNIK